MGTDGKRREQTGPGASACSARAMLAGDHPAPRCSRPLPAAPALLVFVHMPDYVIRIVNARQHHLRRIPVDLPHRSVIVITGPSGSGKSSLAFDTLYAEGQRRYIESLSTYAKQFLERMPK